MNWINCVTLENLGLRADTYDSILPPSFISPIYIERFSECGFFSSDLNLYSP